MFTTIYHPRAWLTNWPRDEKPYASKAILQSHHPELKDDEIMESSFSGPTEGITHTPATAKTEPTPAAEAARVEASAPSAPAADVSPATLTPAQKRAATTAAKKSANTAK